MEPNYYDTLKKAIDIVLSFGTTRYYFNIDRTGYLFENSGITITYIPGRWEEIVDYLYNNKKAIRGERNRKLKTNYNIDYIATQMAKNRDTKTVNDSLVINKYYEMVEDNNDLYKRSDYMTVKNNSDLVFEASKGKYDRHYSIMIYTYGDWEKEIDEYTKQLKNKEIEEFEKDNGSTIDEDLIGLRKKYN